MTNRLLSCILVLLLVYTTVQDAPQRYNDQGPIQLVPDITSFGYSPDQRNLVALTSTGANNTFVFYQGLRLGTFKPVSIVDDPFSVKPSAFAFSNDGSWLIVGTSYGSVYGFQINNATINEQFKLKKDIATTTTEDGIKSISFSTNGLIAVAAKDKVVVLKVPDDPQATEFEIKAEKPLQGILSSVAWKYNSDTIVIVGGYDSAPAEPYFHLFDITDNSINPIEGTTQKTTSIAVFPDGEETILQGRLEEDIQVYKWDGNKNYVKDGTIAGTKNAKKITITKNGQYFGAQITTQNRVLAWKSGITFNSKTQLQNQLQSIAITPYLNQTGKNLALTNDGNSILVLDLTNTVKRWNLCERKFYYDSTTNDCQPCPGTCGQCFDSTNCNTCPDDSTYIDTSNQCQACSGVTDGCEKCSDATTCTACNTVEHFKLAPQNNVCKCEATFYPISKSCSPCSSIQYCFDCTAADQCETCVSTQANHIKQKAVGGACVCVDGWYFDANRVCQDCTIINGCKVCESATKCTTCDGTNNWVSDGNGKCICGGGFWQDGTQCKPCSSKTTYCTACEQNGTCTQCSATRVVSPNKTQCVCQDHTYEDPNSKACTACDPNGQCLHCQPTEPHTCTQCDTNEHRQLTPVQGKCLCEAGYKQNNVTFRCIRCATTGCKDCEDVNICTQCFEEKNFLPTPVDQKCQCKEGYKPDPDVDGQQCLTCGQKIAGCVQCETLAACQSCNATANFVTEPNAAHKCDCQPHYFLTDSVCKLCSDQYSNCDSCDASKCLNCKANYHLTKDGKCLTCAQAIPGCAQCTDANICTTCATDKNWQLDTDTKACVCKNYFYRNLTECKFCGLQFPYCSTCTSQGCDTCQETFSYNKQLKLCFCPEDKQIKDGKCEDKSGLSALQIIAIIVGILAVAGAAVAIIKCFKKRQSPLEDGEYEALEAEKNQ